MDPGCSLTFGRLGDLIVDDNPYLHRVVGRFVHREGFWWLQNHGAKISLELIDDRRETRSQLGPSQQAPIAAQHFSVRFAAGPTRYEVVGRRQGPELRCDELGLPIGTETVDFGVVPLSGDQHLLLVALSAQHLVGGTGLPANRAIAAGFGWSITKFNRKLDAICVKLHAEGVRGLVGTIDRQALDRRRVLVEHAVSSGLVATADLGLLDAAASAA